MTYGPIPRVYREFSWRLSHKMEKRKFIGKEMIEIAYGLEKIAESPDIKDKERDEIIDACARMRACLEEYT